MELDSFLFDLSNFAEEESILVIVVESLLSLSLFLCSRAKVFSA